MAAIRGLVTATLLVARLVALRKSLNTLTNPDFKTGVQDEIQKLEKELNALKTKS